MLRSSVAKDPGASSSPATRIAAAVVATATALAVLAVPTSATSAPQPCADEATAVYARHYDRAAAELVAWVAHTDCVYSAADGSALDLSFANKIEGHGIKKVIVLGGTRAITTSVEAAIKALSSRPHVTRLWGPDRLETMRAVIQWVDGLTRPGIGVPTRPGLYVHDSYFTPDRSRYVVDIRNVPTGFSYCEVHMTYSGRRTGDWAHEGRWGGHNGNIVVKVPVSRDFDWFDWHCG